MVEHKWICVDEYMPAMRVKKSREEGGRDYLESDCVLVWDGVKVEIARVIFDEAGLYWVDRCADVVNVTFWMHLPAAPENLNGDEK